MSEAKAKAGGLQGLFSRPKKYYEDRTDETVTITSSPVELVYVRACKNSELRVQTKLAKCIVESCTDTKVAFEDAIISGTLELIDCQNVTIIINPQDALPTLSAERCNSLHLHYHTPKALGSIYTVQCSNITVHMKPPHQEECVLELPSAESLDQSVSSMQGGKMVTEKVIREGAGYATTVQKKEAADKKQQELLRRFEEHLFKLIKLNPPSSSTSSSSPSTTSTSASAHFTGNEEPVPKKVVNLQTEEEEKEGGEGGELSSMADALRKKKRGLKPTETVERHLPVVGTGRGGGKSGRGGGGRGFDPSIHEDEEKREYFDSPQELGRKVETAVKWLRNSQHAIVFTGAGISTSCGIPDFRSGMNTVLDTGPGVWELRAHDVARPRTARAVPLIKALPSPTHMSIVQLQKEKMVKCTISQNVDGLHRRSGLGPQQLAELHGNTNLETCGKCKRQYLRDFETREAHHVFDHATSRLCDDPGCRGQLEDSIINFGENLPTDELEKAFDHAKKADLCIVLGSSLRVSPANQVPEWVLQQGGRVILCNLQRIPQFPADNRTLPVFCKCDEFMEALMKNLGLQIPTFTLCRRVRLSLQKREDGDNNNIMLTATGLDTDEDVPYSFIRAISTQYNGQTYSASEDPLTLTLPPLTSSLLTLTLSFQGHYREPDLQLQYTVAPGNQVYNLYYHIKEGEWRVEREE